MKLKSIVTSTAVLIALSVGPPPARADQPQNRGGDHARHAQNRTPPRSNGSNRGSAAQPAPRTQRVEPRAGAPRVQRTEPNRAERRSPRNNVPYRYGSQSRSYDRDRRDDHDRDHHFDRGRTIIVAPRPYRYAPYAYRSHRYYRPYYSFRPRLSIGFGMFIGYPVAYPYTIYPTPARVYGYYPPPGTVTAAPSSYGGISLEIGPPDADVYVDGEYVGRAGDFGPALAPLTMIPGRHRIEIAAPGYETLAFDVDVIPGQVIPYQGTLRAY